MTPSPAQAGATGPARTIFFGSGAFAVPMLEALLQLPDVHVVAAVSVPDRPAGRGRLLTAAPLATHSAARNVPLLQPAALRDPGFLEQLAELVPALGVLADYGRIVPAAVLEVPRHGFLNVHPSLLPRHRGATPIPATILARDAEAGVTIIRMDAGTDTGPIVAAERFALSPSETARELEAHAAGAGAALLARTVPAWLAGQLEARPQDGVGASLTRPLGREDGRLDGSETAAASARRVRAFDPWPGTFFELENEGEGPPARVAVLAAESVAEPVAEPGGDPHASDAPGRLVADGSGVSIATTEGRLRLLEVRPAGGRAMTAAEWRRGRPNVIGATTVPSRPRGPQ